MSKSLKLLLAVLAVLAIAPAGAQAWAPAGSAPIHPGVQLITQGAQCTANFVYADITLTNVYIGQAAHCSGKGSNTDTNGCTTPTYGAGTPVDINGDDGTTYTGTIAYSSWETEQKLGEKDANTCSYNDLELVKISAADVGKVNPSVPFWGGPTGGVGGAAGGDTVYSYGNSELRGGVTQLSPKKGTVLSVDGGGWEYTVYTVSPGIPGDSGSGFLNATGQALGVLSFLDIFPMAGGNGVGSLAKEMAYMQAHGGPVAGVVDGTEPFAPPL
jgi:hypothetical protein